jgi:hypothetical protein
MVAEVKKEMVHLVVDTAAKVAGKVRTEADQERLASEGSRSNSPPDPSLMKLSREARRQSKELFDLSMVNGEIDESRLRVIATEIVEKPRHYVQMLKFITRLTRMEVAKRHAIVESATQLLREKRNAKSPRTSAADSEKSPL